MTVAHLCGQVGMSRQNFYKERKSRQRREVDEGLVRDLVVAERQLQPRLGGLKLYGMLGPQLQSAGVKMGRDAFMGALKRQSLLLEPLPKGPRTTMSSHNLPVFHNLIKGLELTAPGQVMASDITYIRTRGVFLYLSLITDMHSRKVVGYHLGRTLEAADTIKALKMALRSLPAGAFPIHHSDRGCQYCCHEYVKLLKERGLKISMTEENHCAENAMAERVNGILKQEYYLNSEFESFGQARRAVRQAILLYNTRRPHRSLAMQTPEQVHRNAA